MRAGSDKPIQINWGFDAEGEPTTNANISLKESMTLSGGYKGFGVGLLIETFSAALTGAMLCKDVNAFSGAKGGPPKTSQFFIVITRAISLVMCLPPNEITK